MKHLYLSLVALGAGLLVGCKSASPTVPVAAQPVPARSISPTGAKVGYDDHLIAGIQRGETDERQLLKWFGAPESRNVQPDGRSHLTWSFRGNPAEKPHGAGTLEVSLWDGKVEAYSAARSSSTNVTGGAAVRESPLPVVYDDQQIAKMKRGETTGAELTTWFGPPEKRSLGRDGRGSLSWTFAPASTDNRAHPGALYVSLAADGSVDAYSARDGSR